MERIRKSGMRARGALCSIGACLIAAAPALADVGLRVTTLHVRVGGVLRGSGNASGMPVDLVSERSAPRPFSCDGGRGLCAPRSASPPGRPYVRLGRLPGSPKRLGRIVRFAFRVPAVPPGRYQVVFWCKPCGRSLLLAGATTYGQVVTVSRARSRR